MYDSTNPSAIPLDAPVVAGYADGRYQWSSADWARFPNAIHISIVCFPGSSGDILDIETGCAAPSDVSGWLDRYNRPVFKVPTLYVNRSNWNAVRGAVGNRQVDYWVATLDGTQVVTGAAAVQFCGAFGSGDPCQAAGDYDISLCQDWWPRLPQPPVSVKPKEFLMIIRNTDDGAVYQVDAAGKRHIGGLEFAAANALGLPYASVTTPTVLEIPDVSAPPAANLQPVLDAITALKAELDTVKAKTDRDLG
jgi:hypothetical protein